MTSPDLNFLQIMKERGFLHQCTDLEGLGKLMAQQKITAYIGFDCTASSLHVGSLMQIMILRWLQKCGHKPIVLMGGGTTKVGDPSGKDESRKLLDDAQINANLQGIKAVFKQYLNFKENGGNALMVNNDDWLKNLNYVSFLRDYGRHFSVNRMLSMDSVKLRLEREQELTFLEFNYMILQAYDFVELHNRFGCRLQFGGSDQWGNIINGVELHRRLMAEKNQGKQNKFDEIFGLTTPLITTSSGAKMGKTANGAVWLNADILSPFDYWQFWRNTEDGDVGRFLRFFTELPIAEIEELEKLQGAGINEAKKILANEATKLCHGPEAALAAAETARKTFEEGSAGDALLEIIIEENEVVLDQNDRTAESISVRELLIRARFADSGSEAKKLILGGGVKINDRTVSDINMKVIFSDFDANRCLKLSKGKKHHALVKIRDKGYKP